MKTAAGLLGALVAGCIATPPAQEPWYISPQARAALPPGTDPRDVRRQENGCYFVVVEGDLSGVIRPVKDIRGEQICDDVFFPGGYRGA